MPVWTFHSIDRYVLVPADGEPVLFEYADSTGPGVPLPRPGHPYSCQLVAVRIRGAQSRAGRGFATDVTSVLREWGVEDARIGIDRLDAYGFLALQEAGLHLVPAQFPLEQARAVKGPEEIALISRSLQVCDDTVSHLYENLRPGRAGPRTSRPPRR